MDKLSKKTTVIYRKYDGKTDLTHLLKIKKYCRKKGYKIFLSNNFKLALKLDLDGAYIPSFNKSTNHLAYKLKKKFIILGSAHNNREIKIKELQGVTGMFLSSVFKKNKNYLGINRFRLLSKLTNKKVVALGGISSKNFKKLRLLNSYGFAGISYFE